MARQQERSPRAQRLVALAAVGFLAAATAFAFARVFIGHEALWKLLLAAAACTAVAGALERRNLVLATTASAACLVVAVGVLVFPQTTLYGLPTKETLRAVGDAFAQVGQQARVQISPAVPLAPLLLAAFTAVWTAAFSAHALAIRAGSPLLAILPSVALLAFADTVLEDGARPIYAIVFLAAALSVIFIDGLRRIRQWGPLWPWPGTGRRTVAASTRAARRVGVLAIAVAAIVPGILPGFRSGPLLDLSTSSGDEVRINPLVSIKAQLERDEPVDLFEVTAPRPSYWRMVTLDIFDGTGFSSSDLYVRNGETIPVPAKLPSSSAPGGEEVLQRFRVLSDLGFPWVPMGFQPETLDVPLDVVRYDRELGSVVTLEGQELRAGSEYTVASQHLTITRDQLRVFSAEDLKTAFQDPALYTRYTQLPEDTPEEIHQIALEWGAGATTPFDQVLAIQDRFLDGSFLYTLEVDNSADSRTLLDFLTNDRRGFCQQFASAMAVLVRELGFPVRLAVGFTTGVRAEGDTNTYRVSTENAHSWVEVHFPGYGWLAFEPTPQRENPVASSYLAPRQDGRCTGGIRGRCAGQGGGRGRRGASASETQIRNRERGPIPTGRQSGTSAIGERGATGVPSGLPYGLLALVLACVAGALLVLVPLVKLVLRRLKLHRVREPRELVLATYGVFEGEAADLGMSRADGETIAEYRARLQQQVRFSDGHLGRLTVIATRAAYSPAPVDDDDALEAAEAARTAIRDMRREAGVVRRVAGIYRPKL